MSLLDDELGGVDSKQKLKKRGVDPKHSSERLQASRAEGRRGEQGAKRLLREKALEALEEPAALVVDLYSAAADAAALRFSLTDRSRQPSEPGL